MTIASRFKESVVFAGFDGGRESVVSARARWSIRPLQIFLFEARPIRKTAAPLLLPIYDPLKRSQENTLETPCRNLHNGNSRDRTLSSTSASSQQSQTNPGPSPDGRGQAVLQSATS